MAVDLLVQVIDVPPLTSAEIATEADALLSEYAELIKATLESPVEVEDIAVSVLDLSVGFDNLQGSFGDRVQGAIWFSRREQSFHFQFLNGKYFSFALIKPRE